MNWSWARMLAALTEASTAAMVPSGHVGAALSEEGRGGCACEDR